MFYFILTDKDDIYSYHEGEGIYTNIKYKTGLNVIDANQYIGSMILTLGDNVNICKPIRDYNDVKNMCYVRIITVPNDMISLGIDRHYLPDHYVEINNKFNKVILSERYHIYDIRFIRKFGIKINKKYIQCVCGVGNIEMLELFKNSGLLSKISLDAPSSCGQVKVLEWLKNSQLSLGYTSKALDCASSNGYVEVLEWLFKYIPKNKLMYTEDALAKASWNGHVNVLDWWFNSGLELKYNTNALTLASRHGHINVLEWWLKSNLELKYDEYDIMENSLTATGLLEVKYWWIEKGLISSMFHSNCQNCDWLSELFQFRDSEDDSNDDTEDNPDDELLFQYSEDDIEDNPEDNPEDGSKDNLENDSKN
jgi:hypothetical protein